MLNRAEHHARKIGDEKNTDHVRARVTTPVFIVIVVMSVDLCLPGNDPYQFGVITGDRLRMAVPRQTRAGKQVDHHQTIDEQSFHRDPILKHSTTGLSILTV